MPAGTVTDCSVSDGSVTLTLVGGGVVPPGLGVNTGIELNVYVCPAASSAGSCTFPPGYVTVSVAAPPGPVVTVPYWTNCPVASIAEKFCTGDVRGTGLVVDVYVSASVAFCPANVAGPTTTTSVNCPVVASL